MCRISRLIGGTFLLTVAVLTCCASSSAQIMPGRYDQWNVAPGYYVAPTWGGFNPNWTTGFYTGESITNYGPYDPFSRFHSPGIYGQGMRVIENPNSRLRPVPRFRQW